MEGGVGSLVSTTYGYIGSSTDSYPSETSPSVYGLTENNTWGVTLADGSTKVRGITMCSDLAGAYVGDVGNPVEANGEDCWCKVTGYQAAGSSEWQNVLWGNSESRWVYPNGGDAGTCRYSCALDCASYVQNDADFRRALFGITQ